MLQAAADGAGDLRGGSLGHALGEAEGRHEMYANYQPPYAGSESRFGDFPKKPAQNIGSYQLPGTEPALLDVRDDVQVAESYRRISRADSAIQSMSSRVSSASQDRASSKRSKFASSLVARASNLATAGLESRRLNWTTNPRVWWRHPLLRNFVTVALMFEDFFIYGQDPTNSSHVTATIPGLGHMCGIIAFWASPTPALGMFKVVLLLASCLAGLLVGRFILVRLLRKRWRLVAFSGCEGAICVVSLMTSLFVLASAFVYNMFLPPGVQPVGSDSLDILKLFGARSMQNRHVNQCLQAFSGIVDIVTILMIMDATLQDRDHWPEWGRLPKRFWRAFNGYSRVICYWGTLIGGSVVCTILVFRTGTGTNEQLKAATIGGSSEAIRALVAATMTTADLLTVAQDWDFPSFNEGMEVGVPVMIAGTFITSINGNVVAALIGRVPWVKFVPAFIFRRLPPLDFFAVSISGKWFTYAPLIGVMVVDLACALTQVSYVPSDFGQYVDPRDKSVWVIQDQDYLNQAYFRGNLINASMITYEARWNMTTGQALSDSALTDVKLTAKYLGQSMMAYLSIPVALGSIVAFMVLFGVADHRLTRERASARLAKELGEGGEVPETPTEEPPKGLPPPEPAAADAAATPSSPSRCLRLCWPGSRPRGQAAPQQADVEEQSPKWATTTEEAAPAGTSRWLARISRWQSEEESGAQSPKRAGSVRSKSVTAFMQREAEARRSQSPGPRQKPGNRRGEAAGRAASDGVRSAAHGETDPWQGRWTPSAHSPLGAEKVARKAPSIEEVVEKFREADPWTTIPSLKSPKGSKKARRTAHVKDEILLPGNLRQPPSPSPPPVEEVWSPTLSLRTPQSGRIPSGAEEEEVWSPALSLKTPPSGRRPSGAGEEVWSPSPSLRTPPGVRRQSSGEEEVWAPHPSLRPQNFEIKRSEDGLRRVSFSNEVVSVEPPRREEELHTPTSVASGPVGRVVEFRRREDEPRTPTSMSPKKSREVW